MSATTTTMIQPAGVPRRLSRERIIRFALVAAAVGVCYLFEWRWLRVLTLEMNLRLDALAGIHMQRIGWDSVMWKDVVYKYRIACTFADVWCGAIPLLWNRRKNVGWNAGYVLLFGLVLLAFNVFRLSVSDVLFALGLSWDLAHNVISGVSYFLVWMWIWKHRSWA